MSLSSVNCLVLRGAGQNPLIDLRELINEGICKEFILEIENFLNMNSTYRYNIIEWCSSEKWDSLILNEGMYFFPLNFIVQMTNYYKLHDENLPISSIIGHSQGLIGAVVISLSSDICMFLHNCKIGALMLAHQGYRMGMQFNDIASRMISVKGMEWEFLSKLLPGVEPALINTDTQFVFSGNATLLNDIKSKLVDYGEELNQNKIIYNERKPYCKVIDIPMTVAAHSSVNDGLLDILANDMISFNFQNDRMQIPVFGNDGKLINIETDLMRYLFRSQLTDQVNWVKIIKSQSNIKTFIDLGPGKRDGLFHITLENIRFDQELILCTEINRLSHNSELCSVLASRNMCHSELHEPRTKLTETLKCKYPFWIAGMTPTSCSPLFVANAVNAGVCAELAGGGYPTEKMFIDAVNETSRLTKKPFGINIIYANPRLWNFQYPISIQLKRGGTPIDGICIGAGVPSKDVGIEIVKECQDAGMRWVSFKPSTVTTIRTVIDIANAVPSFNIVLQWTCGYAGGHHSYENFTDSIHATYREIRNANNIILIAGSGMGSGEHAYKYLSGDFNQMIFDGILFGSAVMAVKESNLSLQCKQLLVDTPGISNDANWTDTQNGVIGGVTSIYSELGERIHVVANKGALAWKEIDQMIKNKTMNHDRIIQLLNNYQKPYFGDLENMTHSDVINRFASLLPINPHPDFLRKLKDVEKLFNCRNGMLSQYEIDRFLNICNEKGTKLPPFIPIIDENFEYWFKKDSLWYCENESYDANKVIILQSPVSVRFIDRVNEPIEMFLERNMKELQKVWERPYYYPSISIAQPDSLDFFELFPMKEYDSFNEDELNEFISNTKISEINSKFGYICARSVSNVFAWMLRKFSFNPNGVIHKYQYFKKGDNYTVGDKIVSKIQIVKVEHKATRTEITVRTEFRTVLTEFRTARAEFRPVCAEFRTDHVFLGETVSCFSMLGRVTGIEIDSKENIFNLPQHNIKSFRKSIRVPVSGDQYAKISTDMNPIHRIPEYALKSKIGSTEMSTIVHGMWTASTVLSCLEDVKEGYFRFVAPLFHTQNGILIVTDDCVRSNDITILESKLYTKQRVGICFAGQGSLSQGDGLQMYEKNKNIKRLYDDCTKYIWDEFGVNILNILKFNPKEIWIELNETNQKYWMSSTVSHPEGVVNYSPFSQVLTVLYEYALYTINPIEYHLIAGHSLGEYLVPVIVFNMDIRLVLKLVMIRGLNMVGNSEKKQYRMVSINPSRIGKTIEDLEKIVNAMNYNNHFVEIVNYNILNRQYIITGDIESLSKTISAFENDLSNSIHLGRTKTSVVLSGIDLPFHSSYMTDRAKNFRSQLTSVFTEEYNYNALVGKYIPNLTGKVFEISKQYAQLILDIDPLNDSILHLYNDWDMYDNNTRAMIFFIELLTLQFCNKVKWIDTSEIFEKNCNVVYEISPKPILTKMFLNPSGKMHVEC